MALTIAQLCDRLLEPSGHSLSSGVTEQRIKNAAADAIARAVFEMRAQAPDIFKRQKGFRLNSSQTGTITVSTSNPDRGTLSSGSLLRNNGCTARISGMDTDVTMYQVPGAADTEVAFSPAFTGSSYAGLAVTIFQDAVLLADGSGEIMDVVDEVRINGGVLKKVSKRTEAERAYHAGQLRSDYGRDRSDLPFPYGIQVRAAGTPCYWWTERTRSHVLLSVYPMPSIVLGLDVEGQLGFALPDTGTLATNTSTIDFSDEFCISIFLPIAKMKWAATEFFASPSTLPAIELEYKRALERLSSIQSRDMGPGILEIPNVRGWR